MRLLADPSGFDRGGEHLEARVGWQVRHIVFLLASRPAFADEPDLVARHALHTIVAHAVLMAIRNGPRSSGIWRRPVVDFVGWLTRARTVARLIKSQIKFWRAEKCGPIQPKRTLCLV